MNKRILELAEQTGMLKRNDEYCFPEEDLLKFAELIIGDCAEMCDTLKADYFKQRRATFEFDEKQIFAEGETACDTLKHRMKRHFLTEGK